MGPNHCCEGRKRRTLNTITALGQNATGQAGHQNSEASPWARLSSFTFALSHTKWPRTLFFPESSSADPFTARLGNPNPTPCLCGLRACGWRQDTHDLTSCNCFAVSLSISRRASVYTAQEIALRTCRTWCEHDRRYRLKWII